MCGGALRRSFVSHPIEEREMTTPSQITYCTAQARTADYARAAGASRDFEQRGPRSTFRPLGWIGRCSSALAPTPAAHSHS
jgi:hypothetical protein